jgi:hypothetical protein
MHFLALATDYDGLIAHDGMRRTTLAVSGWAFA